MSRPLPEPASVGSLQASFLRSFHIELPPEFIAPGLQPFGHEQLLSTRPDALSRVLVGTNRETLMSALEDGHHTVGFWGHGSNSYAFYFLCRRPGERIYLRLHTGGAYSDPAKAAADISDFIPPFVHLLRETRRRSGRLAAFESMGQGWYALQVDGRARQVTGALCGRPECIDIFKRLFEGQARGADPAELQRIDALRASALALAKTIYAEEIHRPGNERVGMRAMGAAMDLIRGLPAPTSAREFQFALLGQLAALGERHQDLDGDHAHGRSCVHRLMAQWKQGLASDPGQ